GGEDCEQCAPASAPMQQQLSGGGRGQRSESAEHNHPTVHGGDAVFREPQDDRFESAGERRCDAEPDESAAQNERRKSLRQAEEHGASRREQQPRTFDASGSIAIEPYPDWQLESCEGQKIDRREKAKIGGIKGQL